MWSTTVPLNPKVQMLWSYFYNSCDFAHVGGEHYFGQKSTYNIYPNKSPPTLLIFSPIGSLMPNFRQFWRADFEISEKNTTFWVWGPHTTHAGKRVPPRPATTKDSTRYARNHGRDHPEAGGAVRLFPARVVERHASACLRTVGVDSWRCYWFHYIHVIVESHGVKKSFARNKPKIYRLFLDLQLIFFSRVQISKRLLHYSRESSRVRLVVPKNF